MSHQMAMVQSKKLTRDVTTELRQLAHDLSNSIETILQASYLLARTRLDADGKRWIEMIEAAASDAAQVNRSLRKILQSRSEKPRVRRRAS